VEEVIELALVYLNGHVALGACLGNPERAAVEALVEQAEPGAVEEEHLESGAALAEEDEERAAAGLASDPLERNAGEAFESPPKVDGLERNEDLDTARDHLPPPRPARSSSTSRSSTRVRRSKPGPT